MALFEPETSFGAWYQFTDALGLPHLCLRLGVFALDALPVAHEWHGVEVAGADDTTSDEVRANFVLVALGSVRSSTLPVADVDESLEEAVERFCFEQGISWDEAGVELAAEIEAALAKDELIQRDALDAGSASFDRRLDSSYRSAVEDLSDRFREAGDLLGDDRLLDSLRGHQLPRIRARARLAWQACCPMSDLIGPDREDLYLEYKPTLRWGVSRGEGRVLKDREDAVVKTIAAFANGEFGGTLLIGVADEGTVLGLSDDYETFAGHGSRDAFTQHLFNLLQRDVGVAAAALVGVDFERFDDLDVCRVHVAPSAEPVFAGGERQRFFWRLGPATIDVKDGVERQRIIERRFRGWR